MANEIAEKLRRMALARAKMPHMFSVIARDYEALSMEAIFMNEAADLIEVQEQKIEGLTRIITRLRVSERQTEKGDMNDGRQNED